MFTAIGVHVFMGAFSVGVERHFSVTDHLEVGPFGTETFKHNRPKVHVHINKDRNWDGLEKRGSKCDLVFGNPPCSGFSPMTDWNKTKATLTGGIGDVVRKGSEFKARVIAIESVRGMTTKGLPLLNKLWSEVRDEYPGSFLVNVNAFNHGVSQIRPRTFWILSRTTGFRPSVKDATGAPLLETIASIPASAPNQEAMDGSLRPGVVKLFKHLKPGQGIGKLPVELIAKHDQFYADRAVRWSPAAHMHWPHRVDPQKMPTIFGKEPKYVHPTEHRLMTVREIARVMGIPDEFEILGPLSGQIVQMSKGVCPPVGAWLAREIAAFLRGEREPVKTPEIVLWDDEPKPQRCSSR